MNISPCFKDTAASKLKPDNTLNTTMNQLSQSLTQAYETHSDSPYLSLLPAEVRNEIYKYLLISTHIITPERQAVGPLRHYSKFTTCSQPALEIDATVLRACRAIAYEGYPVLYGQNTFSFSSPTEMKYFKLAGLESGRGRRCPDLQDALSGETNRKRRLHHGEDQSLQSEPLSRIRRTVIAYASREAGYGDGLLPPGLRGHVPRSLLAADAQQKHDTPTPRVRANA